MKRTKKECLVNEASKKKTVKKTSKKKKDLKVDFKHLKGKVNHVTGEVLEDIPCQGLKKGQFKKLLNPKNTKCIGNPKDDTFHILVKVEKPLGDKKVLEDSSNELTYQEFIPGEVNQISIRDLTKKSKEKSSTDKILKKNKIAEKAFKKALKSGGTPALRKKACTSAEFAYYYAKEVDKEPNDDTRTAACGYPYWALQYAKDLDKGYHLETFNATLENKIKDQYLKEFDLRVHEIDLDKLDKKESNEYYEILEELGTRNTKALNLDKSPTLVREAVKGNDNLKHLFGGHTQVEMDAFIETQKGDYGVDDAPARDAYFKAVDRRQGAPETRRLACTSPHWAYSYAKDVDKGFHSETYEAVKNTPLQKLYESKLGFVNKIKLNEEDLKFPKADLKKIAGEKVTYLENSRARLDKARDAIPEDWKNPSKCDNNPMVNTLIDKLNLERLTRSGDVRIPIDFDCKASIERDKIPIYVNGEKVKKNTNVSVEIDPTVGIINDQSDLRNLIDRKTKEKLKFHNNLGYKLREMDLEIDLLRGYLKD